MRYAIIFIAMIAVAFATSSATANDQPSSKKSTSLKPDLSVTLVTQRGCYKPKKNSQQKYYYNYGKNYSYRPRYPVYPHYGPSNFRNGRQSGSFYYGFGPYNSVPYRYYGH